MTIGEQYRLVKEAVNEAVTDKVLHGFQRTHADRCEQLFDQLKQHEKHLTRFLNQLGDYEHRSRGILTTTRAVLSVPALIDASRPPSSVPTPVGRDTVVGMGPLITGEESRLRTSVALPCELWLAEFGLLKERMPVLRKARLSLDSRRRQEAQLQDAWAQAQSASPPTDFAKHVKHNRRIEQAAQLLAHKQSKLSCSVKTFAEEEAAVYQTLVALASETRLVPTHVATAVAIFQEFFTHVSEAFPHIPPQAAATAGALEGSNHHDLWRDATSPAVILPVLPARPVDPFHPAAAAVPPPVEQYHPLHPAAAAVPHPPAEQYRDGLQPQADARRSSCALPPAAPYRSAAAATAAVERELARTQLTAMPAAHCSAPVMPRGKDALTGSASVTSSTTPGFPYRDTSLSPRREVQAAYVADLPSPHRTFAPSPHRDPAPSPRRDVSAAHTSAYHLVKAAQFADPAYGHVPASVTSEGHYTLVLRK